MYKEKITILLSTFNRAHLITETLESILQQTYSNWECIIIDDYSEDNTKEVVKTFQKRDARFTYFEKIAKYKKGLSGSRNFGLEIARERSSDFIQFFDDDDIMHPEKLEIQIKLLNENPSAEFCLCGNRNFKELSKIRFQDFQKLSFDSNLSLGEAFVIGKIKFGALVPLFRKSYITKYSFDTDLAYAEEWVLFSKIFNITQPNYCVTEKVLFFRRKHPQSITEGSDYNFEKIKTSQITGLKVFYALKEHSALSKKLLDYFAFHFLVNQYNLDVLKEIEGIYKEGKKPWRGEGFVLRLVFWINKLSRKTILKLLQI